MTAGVAIAVCVMRPDTFPELLVGLGAAVVGSVISDIDVGSSGSGRAADGIIWVSAGAVAAVAAMERFWNVGVWDMILRNSSLLRVAAGSLGFIGVCAFGKAQPHRSFMHSFLALGILSIIMGTVLPAAVPYFALAFLTHLGLDVLNYKKVRILYPRREGLCFRLFHADGTANWLLFSAGLVMGVWQVGMCVWRILRLPYF